MLSKGYREPEQWLQLKVRRIQLSGRSHLFQIIFNEYDVTDDVESLNSNSMKTPILILFTLITAVVNAQRSSVDSVSAICRSEAMSSLKKIVEKEYGNPTESTKKAIKIATLTRYEARVNYLDKKLHNDFASTAPGDLDIYTKAIFDEYKAAFPELTNDFYERVTERVRNLK
jgi:hypothetical protein